MNARLSKMSPTATWMIRMDHSYVMTQVHKLERGISRGEREVSECD